MVESKKNTYSPTKTPDCSTVSTLLQHRAQDRADRVVFRFSFDGESESDCVSYGELDCRARAIATQLQSEQVRGARVLLLYPSGLDYIAAFFGCLYAGAIAVPAYPPRNRRHFPRIEAILKDSKATIALTNSTILPQMRSLLESKTLNSDCQWMTTDDLPSGLENGWVDPRCEPSDLAFVQYTSGSTGNPKGVKVSHANLLHNAAAIQHGFIDSDRSMGVSWLPPYHDMGLIGGIVQPIYVGAATVLMPPEAFLQKPLRWLQAISTYRVSTSGGPNFAYDFCARRISPEQVAQLDLSCWELAFNGAEPIRADTLDRFTQKFAPAGFRREAFYPCYGMAEATLFVTGSRRLQMPVSQAVDREALTQGRVVAAPDKVVAAPDRTDAKVLVGCGQTAPAMTVKIVDPDTRVRCESGRVGEIWVSGANIAEGYWQQPERTEATFAARLADTDSGPFLRTGDLGFWQDGELFVTGRLKTAIVIRGRNYYPHDIESVVQNSHAAFRLGCGAAFGFDGAEGEQLAIVQEVERTALRSLDPEAAISAARRAIAEAYDLSVAAIVLIKPGAIPKTSSGKIQHHRCREDFLADRLGPVAQWQADRQTDDLDRPNSQGEDSPPSAQESNSTQVRSQQQIQTWLVDRVARLAGESTQSISVMTPLAQYGLSSVEAVTLSGELSDWLDVELSPTLAYNYPTIASLSVYLADVTGASISEGGQADSSVEVKALEKESIAIIGIGCRFPGANSPEAFWQLLQDRRSATAAVADERWTVDDSLWDDLTPQAREAIQWGGFLDRVDEFDPQFFGITPREAVDMDPQQRILMEVTWEALERAGCVPTELAGSKTGVFIGISSNDYAHLNSDNYGPYVGTGNASSIAANRLSYSLDLRGPSLAIDTACSSSLVAIHQATRSLRSQESNLAIVGGVNLMLTPNISIAFARAGMLAADGRCKTFDASADGYVRGEGCGVVILKRLQDAVRDGDPIVATIRGSAVVQDGRSNGLTAPNGPSQAATIRQALADAGVEASAIDYVEAHGTGTSLGDPIEMEALQSCLAADRDSQDPCWVGSVKTNIGHLEAAAGIAGAIKVALALQHGEIPASLHLDRLNPAIATVDPALQVARTSQGWGRNGRCRMAGVSSFGFGGTNCHTILAEAPERVAQTNEGDRSHHVLALSAKSDAALLQLVRHYGEVLKAQAELELADVCYTANTNRSHFEHRLALVADSSERLHQQLRAFEDGREDSQFPGWVGACRQDVGTEPKIAFLFGGQGSQYIGMGRQLYETEPVFRQTLARCAAVLDEYLEQPLLAVLYPSEGESEAIHETAYAQPVLFSLEYSLAQLWMSWGVRPTVVLGHSVGEYVAACVAGVFSLETGLQFIAKRGQLMQSLPSTGVMAAVATDPERVGKAIASVSIKAGETVEIATLNGPTSTVISGTQATVEKVLAMLAEAGIQTKYLQVSHAFHSHLMEPMLEAFALVASAVEFVPPQIELISNVTGKAIGKDIAKPDYWCRHIRQPVQFAAGMETLRAKGCDILIDLSPKPLLMTMGQQCWSVQADDPSNPQPLWIPSLRADRENWETLTASLAQLYVRGLEIDWRGFDRSYHRQHLPLPTYPFQKERYWVKNSKARSLQGKVVHPLLGAQQRLAASPERRFEQVLAANDPAWIEDHRVCDRVIFPGAACVELALAASSGAIENVLMTRPLVLERAAILQTVVADDGKIQMFAQPEGDTEWVHYATAYFDDDSAAVAQPGLESLRLDELSTRCSQHIELDELYDALAMLGLHYGPHFKTLRQLQVGNGEFLARVEVTANVADIEDYRFTPMLLDGAFQAIAALQSEEGDLDRDFVYLPASIDSVQTYRALGTAAVVYGRGQINDDVCIADLTFGNEQGEVLAIVQGVRCRRTSRQALRELLQSNRSIDELLYAVRWQQVHQDLATPVDIGNWLILGQETIGGQLAQLLEAKHQQVQYVQPQAMHAALDVLEATDRDGEALTGIVLVCDAKGENAIQQLQADVAASLPVIQDLVNRNERCPRGLTILTQQGVAIDAAEDVNPAQAALWGLGRTLQAEQPQLRLRLIDVEKLAPLETSQLVDILLGESEPQLALRQTQSFTPRLLPLNKSNQLAMPPGGEARLAIVQRGSLDNLRLELDDCALPSAGEVQVAVRAAGLNFRDVLNALGAYPGDPGSLGGEMAGIVTAVGEDVHHFAVGDRVFGLSQGCFATRCNAPASLLVWLPDSVDFAAAATVPVTFCTAQAAFDLLGLKRGDKILIHAAAGGVGLAAIQLAQAIGAEIYATASAPKQAYLRQLGIQHIYNSRTTDFGEQIRRDTNGTGVDAILNSLTSAGFIEASLSALASGGRFVEIGKRDIWSAEQMAQARSDVRYHVLAIDDWMAKEPEKVRDLLEVTARRLAAAELQPLHRRIYPLTEATAAMRYMQQARHIGKVVLDVSHAAIRSDASYVITGGLGALGLKACMWLIDNGAKHVVLTSRRPPAEEVQQRLSAIEAEYECTIVVCATDVANAEQVSQLIHSFGHVWPKLAGILHAAGVLDDGTIAEQTLERFTKAIAPKAIGAYNLHQATQDINLDFFVTYSSVAAALGSAGQSNYATANAFLDGLAQHRRARGLAATSINWGPWAEAGMAANAVVQANLARQGLTALQSGDAHVALAQMVASGHANGLVLDADWSRMSRWLGAARPPLLSNLLLAPVRQGDNALLQQLRSVTDVERQQILSRHLQQELQKILQLAQPPDPEVGFFDLGMDSLMAVELYNRLQQQLGDTYVLPSTVAFDYPTITQLATHLAAQLSGLARESGAKQHAVAQQAIDTDAVAIVGLACRFPGAADKDAYWQLLSEQVDAIGEVPSDRWDIDAFYDPDPDAPGKMTTRYGGFIEGIDQFDATFFGIAPREAVELDPQQRLLLEMSWQALEDANIAPATLMGSRTGVYVGISTTDYSQLIARAGTAGIGQYMGTGTAHSAAVGRISYALGLEGPSLAIDTACSSSLVALHQARKGLMNDECDMALVGGVNAILTPEPTIYFSRGRFMAPDGRCKTFDAAADGYVRGEGCGVVVLKRLSDAERDGDRIYGLVRGSAVNQDGASGGLTVPKGSSQQRVIEAALAEAQMQPEEVAYVEAHGTGTSLGDPIEVQALQTVLGTSHSSETPLLVGSVKTNIGHLEAAAGIASIIKVALSLQQDSIPGQLHFQTPSPRIPWDSINIRVAAEAHPWPSDRKVAGISGFAFQGTNAHVLLEGYQSQSEELTSTEAVPERPTHLLALSGKHEQAVRALASNYLGWLQAQPESDIADVCHTAGVGRSHLAFRTGLVATTREQLCNALEQVATGQIPIDRQPQLRQVACLFTGQGSQYVGMGRGLYETQPTFKQTLDRCADILDAYLDRPLLEILYASDDRSGVLHQTVYTQPILFAVEYALYQLWLSWGIQPAVVMGHSVGEYVAACVAGVFSLEDGLKLIATRGKLMQQLPAGGAMVSLMAPVQQVKDAIAAVPQVAIAGINGPISTVISGPEAAVGTVVNRLQEAGVKSKTLQVSHAFHSPLMKPMLAEFEQVARQVNYAPPRIKFISNVTGEVSDETVATPEYWCQHVLAPVNFAAGMNALHQLGCDIFLECGPKPILLGMGQQCLSVEGAWLPSLRPEWDDWTQMLTSLGQLYCQGMAVNWAGFDRDYPQRRKVDLPTYPFQRQTYWIADSPRLPDSGWQSLNEASSKTQHPLLGRSLEIARSSSHYFEAYISSNTPDYLEDHCVFDAPIVPMAAWLEVALAAGQKKLGDRITISNLKVERPLFLNGETFTTTQVILTPADEDEWSLEILSLSSARAEDNSTDKTTKAPEWVLHTTGLITVNSDVEAPVKHDLTVIQEQCPESLVVEDFYQQFVDRGISYGPLFRVIKAVWHGDGRALAQLDLSNAIVADLGRYCLHPVLLDAGFQAVGAALGTEVSELYLPVEVEHLHVFNSAIADVEAAEIWSYVQVRSQEPASSDRLVADVELVDGTGSAIARIGGLTLKRASREQVRGVDKDALQDWFYQVEWQWQGRLGGKQAPDYIPALSVIRDRLQQRWAVTLTDADMLRYRDAFPPLEALCSAYIAQALQQLDWTLQVGQSFSAEEVIAKTGTIEQYRDLLHRLLAILAEEDVLQRQALGWSVVRLPEAIDVDEMVEELATKHPEIEAELALTSRCGRSLAKVLQGLCDPLQELLAPDGDLSSLTKLYRDSPGAVAVNRLLQEAVVEAISNLPGDRAVRILEVGAGTGATTSNILPHLPEHQLEYTFTDISAAFLTQAKAQFGDRDCMRYRLLDVEVEPQEQDFELGHYDIVIAANVLHATADLRQTLTHIRQLLAPGGALLLLEGTRPARWLDLVFGLTEGWWRFRDRDLRPHYPLLSTSQWQSLLQECEFEDAIGVTSAAGGDTSTQQDVIVARASQASSEVSDRPQERWLVLGDRQEYGRELVRCLKADGAVASWVAAGREFVQVDGDFTIDRDRPEHYRQLLAEVQQLGQPLAGILHLWSLDSTDAKDLAAEQLHADAQLTCGTVLHLIQALGPAQLPAPPRLWLVTCGAVSAGRTAVGLAQSSLWGMARTIVHEHPELKCSRLDLDPELELTDAEVWRSLFSEVVAGDREQEIALRSEQRWVARLSSDRPETSHKRLQLPEAEPFHLQSSRRGLLENLEFQPCSRRSPEAGEIEIRVRATGLNFRDVLQAMGLLDSSYAAQLGLDAELIPYGFECTGEVVAIGAEVTGWSVGDAAIAAVTPGGFSRYVTVPANTVVPKPESLSFAAAATLPTAFLTAYYSLSRLAQVKPGDRVLVHAAAGGVGMAAVQIAQYLGAEVFGTASPSKWQTLRDAGVTRISSSRSLGFADDFLAATDGAGVDVVLNCLSGEFIPASLGLLKRQGGRFVELGKRDILSPATVAESYSHIEYGAFDLGEVAIASPETIADMLAELMPLFANGTLQPLPHTTFAIEDTIAAFRYMQQARHVGKIVVEQASEADEASSNLTTATLDNSIRFHADGTYLISGGLGDLGLLTAKWMVERGAKTIVLVGRSEASTIVQPRLEALQAAGATVVTARADVSQREQLEVVFRNMAATLPPLKGIIHAAGLLDDGVLSQLAWSQFDRVLAPKVLGAWNLHQLSQGQSLDLFVLFSSAASLFGSPAQANHAAANAFLDTLAHYRRSLGLAGQSINWGIWSDIGAAAKRNAAKRDSFSGLGTISPLAGLQAFEQVLLRNQPQVGVVPVDWAHVGDRAIESSPFLARFSSRARAGSRADSGEFLKQLQATPVSERRSLLSQFLRDQIAAVLGFNSTAEFDSRQGLMDLGMDSLTSLELKHRIEAGLNYQLRPTVAFDYPTIAELEEHLATDVLGLEQVAASELSAEMPAAEAPHIEEKAMENDDLLSLLASVSDMSDGDIHRQMADRGSPH